MGRSKTIKQPPEFSTSALAGSLEGRSGSPIRRLGSKKSHHIHDHNETIDKVVSGIPRKGLLVENGRSRNPSGLLVGGNWTPIEGEKRDWVLQQAGLNKPACETDKRSWKHGNQKRQTALRCQRPQALVAQIHAAGTVNEQ